MRSKISVFIFLVVAIVGYSFTVSQIKEDGELTQVKHIDFQKAKLPKELKPILGELVYIPAGTFISALELDGKTIAVSRQISVASFYLGKTEVTNAQYKLFCKEMITLVGKDSAIKLLPDTTAFVKDIGKGMDAYVQYYFSHSSYADYPVVGVSWHQAHAYCEWLTKKLQELYKSHPDWSEKYPITGIHLPTEMEWEYAALGNQLRSKEKCPYSWGYDLFHIEKEKLAYKGKFGKIVDRDGVVIKDHEIAGSLGDDTYLTAKSVSYSPNDYGIYNLSGNVNEWVTDIFRSTDKTEFDLMPSGTKDSTIDRSNYSRHDNAYYLNGSDKEKFYRVIKGGGFLDGPAHCLISNRRSMDPDSARCDVGFRISMICTGGYSGK